MQKIVLSIMILLISGLAIFAQSSAGRLVGTVSSADGVLPGATVEIRDNATGKIINVVTSSEGAFTVPNIDPGVYTATVRAAGFKVSTVENIKVDIGREYSLNVTLEIGEVTETVVVTAGTDIVNSSNAEISTTVSQREILELPINGRNPLSLVALQPGNNAAGINGTRTSSQNYTRDGINVQDVFIRNGFVADTPTTDNTGEFTVAAANTGAESGFGSSQIQLFTPRGGQEYHGALFAYNRNSAFAANTFFGNRQGRFLPTDAAVIQGRAVAGDPRQPRPFLNRNQFGGKFSGPLPFPRFGDGGGSAFIRDKVFFFFSTEKFELRQQVNKTTTVLRPDARQGIFAYTPTSTPAAGQCITYVNNVCRVNILTGQGLTGAIPAAQNGVLALDPVIFNRIVSQLPDGNRPDIGDGLNTIGYGFSQSDPENRREYTFRGDADINDRNSVSVTYRYNRTEDARTDLDTSFNPTALVATNAPIKFVRAGWVFNNGGNFTNELMGGLQDAPVIFENRVLPDASYLIGIPLVTSPEVTFRDQGRNTKFWTIKDNASYIWGNHVLRFGGEYQKYSVVAFNEAGVSVPTYSITGTGNLNTPRLSLGLFPGGISSPARNSADALRYLLGGIVGGGTAAANATSRTSGYVPGAIQDRTLEYDTVGLYVTDQWKVRPNLTLNLGVRYERYSSLKAPNGLYLEPVLGSDPVASILSTTGTIDFVGRNSGTEGHYTKADNNNFGPVVSAAYSFKGKGFLKYLFGGEGMESVLRGGFAMKFVNDEYFRSLENALLNNTGLSATAVAVQNNSTQLNARFNNLPELVVPTYVQPPFDFSVLTSIAPYATGNRASLFAIDPNLQIPLQYDYSLSFTRQLNRDTALQVSYVGTRSSEMVRTIDYGQVDITNNGFGEDYVRAFRNAIATGTVNANGSITPGSIFGSPTCLSSGACQSLTVIPNLPVAAQNYIQTNIGAGSPADDATTLVANRATGSVQFLANPLFSPVNILNNGGKYRYNALQVELRRRYAQGLILNAKYTFQKILTDVQDDGVNQTRVSPYLDNNNPELNYSRPSYDVTQTFNLVSLYELPFGKDKPFLNYGGFMNAIFGGWTFGNILQIQTSTPLTFFDTRGTLNRSGRSGFQTGSTNLTNAEIRDLLGVREENGNIYFIDPSVISSSGRGADGLLNPFQGQVFLNNQPFTTGNISRYNFNGPLYWNWDASLQKDFRFNETMKIVLRAEAFNVTNSVRFGNPNTDINSATFGRITGAYSPRIMQFGARFEF